MSAGAVHSKLMLVTYFGHRNPRLRPAFVHLRLDLNLSELA
jgi:hypothetical protein